MKIWERYRWLFVLPPRLRESFYESTVRINRVTLTIIGVMIVLMESFNLCRVLFWSRSGLSSVNNRIYFTFYLVLLLFAIAWLLLQKHWWNQMSALRRSHKVMAAVLLLWSAALNAYDIYSGHTANTTVLATPALALAVLLQAEPRFLVPWLGGTYVLFVAGTYRVLDSGSLLNLSVAVAMGMVSVLAHFYYVVQELQRRQELDQINTELRTEQDKLRLILEQHRLIMDQSSDIVFRWDVEADCMEFSRNWTELFDFPAVVPEFRKWLTEDHGQDPRLGGRLLEQMQKYKAGTAEEEYSISLRLRSGERRWYRLKVHIQQDSAGRVVQCFGVLRDVSEQQIQIERLQSQLQTDGLTGIFNRAAVESRTGAVLESMHPGDALAMLILDLDNFKMLNDTYGHPCGDYVLEETARGMRRVFRESDVLGRIGGDEFAVVLPGMRDPELLRKKTEQLIGHVRAITWQDQQIGASCSVGGVLIREPMTFDQLYRAADQALYRAKGLGKDQVYLESR